MKWEIDNLNDLEKVAKEVLDRAKNLDKKNDESVVVALYGDLGSGKTTFTKYLAKTLGITERVTSPTFIIQKTFNIPEDHQEKAEPFKKLIHIDTYRLDLQDELVRLGWQENVMTPENLIAVEWPENIPDILPENTICLHFKFVNETTREIEMD